MAALVTGLLITSHCAGSVAELAALETARQ